MLDVNNQEKEKQMIKRKTIYNNYIKEKEKEKFLLRDNIISIDLKEKLANSLKVPASTT